MKKLAFDIGGTFTDFSLIDAEGKITLWKEASTPKDSKQAIIKGLNAMSENEKLPLSDFLGRLDLFVHGQTIATNTVIQRNGPKTAVLCTEGFRDVIHFRDGFKPQRYNIQLQPPKDFVPRYLRIPVTERVNYKGDILKALDDKTLKVTLKNPTPFFIGLLSHYSTWPVHKETVLEYGDIDDRRGLWTRPGSFVCNGAMNLKSWELNKKIVVEKNPLYWDAESVKLNEIHFYPVSDVNTEDRMFSAGQLHLTSTVPSEMCPLWIEQGNPNLRIDPYMGTYFYRTNTTIEPLNDVRVRKALALAIDRNHITKNVNKCGAIPAYSFTPPGSNGYFPDTKIGTDLELAKSLLAEAGYPNGEGFPELEILFNTSEGHRQIALAIQQMWKKNLGINVILDNMDWKVYLSREMIGDFQISRAGWIGDYEDPNTFLDTLRPNRGNNKTGWDNKEFDSLVKLANETTNQEKRYELLREAERILIDEMPIIPIYTYVRAYQLSPDVKGFYPNYLDHHHPKTIYLERE